MINMSEYNTECICVIAGVRCAYLNERIPKNDPGKLVNNNIDPIIAIMLIEVDPSKLLYVREDDSIIAELYKAP